MTSTGSRRRWVCPRTRRSFPIAASRNRSRMSSTESTSGRETGTVISTSYPSSPTGCRSSRTWCSTVARSFASRSEKEAHDGSYFYEQNLEDVLLAGERLGMEHRLDVMNSRAALYDAWRQIRVTANALKGVFNVTLTNQFLTPPTTTNPFAFLEQAKQFSLVINAQLPLVRLQQRNAFRIALINYQRARRTLMNVEDFTKFQVRQDIRNMQTHYLTYEINRRNLVLTVRQKDQAFEQIIAPPPRGQRGNARRARRRSRQPTLSTSRAAADAGKHAGDELADFQLARLPLYRDLGIMPYDEWEAFHELFPAKTVDREPHRRPGGGPARGPAAAPAEVIRR